MKTMFLILGCLIIAAIIAPLLAATQKVAHSGGSLRKIQRALGLHAGLVQLNAFGDGNHTSGVITKRADAVHTARHLLVKVGSNADHIAICTDGDLPLGVCSDEPSAIEDPANVQLLGAVPGTLLAVASEAITVGSLLYTADDGKVQNTPAGAGTYYQVGRAITASSADGDVLEMVPCMPIALVVS